MNSYSVLVIEDDRAISELLEFNLQREGFTVQVEGRGDAGLEQALETMPDLILLDLMLPGMNGLEICRRLKQNSKTREIPIVMLTAKDEEADIIAGLELGADDYITKPFSPKVVIARAKAVLRRKTQPVAGEEDPLTFEGLEIHPGKHAVLVDGTHVELTKSEFNILHYLARHPSWVFTRYQLVDAAHGEHHSVSDRSIDVQVVGLRKKLGARGSFVETVRGIGYRFRV
jgi:two-component system alkaline phosphatase synthesis response regulator PhoP